MPVTVKYTADTKELESGSKRAEQSLKGVGDAADDAGKKSGGFASALKGASTVAGGFVLGSAITKAPGFLIDAAKAAAEDEQATARLDQALRNTSGSFDDNKAKIDARIDAGAKLAFGDDDVRDSFEQLLVATDDTDEALRRQAIAMDLARGTGMSLTQASKLLGKVNEENVDQFKKLGIEIESGATEEEALAAVQAKFAGQADTYASSSAAQFEKFHQQMGELQETIGTAVLPVLSALGTILIENVVPAMSTVAEEVAPKIAAVLVPAIDGLSVAFQNAAPYLQAVFGFMADHQEILIALGVGLAAIVVPAIIALGISAAASAIGMIALAAPFIAIALIVGGISLAIIELVKHWDDITAKYPIVGQISDALKEKFDAFIAFIRDPFLPAVQSIYDKISKVVGDVVGFVEAHWHEVWDTIEPVLKVIGDGVALYFGIVQTTVETVINAVRDIINIVMGLLTGDWDRAWNGLKDLVNDVWEGIKSIASDAIHFIETDLVPLMLTAAGKLGEALKDGIVAGVKGILNNTGDFAEAMIGALKGAMNSAMKWMHDNVRIHVPGFDPPGPGSIPDFDWGFPLIQFATGGIVNGATPAIVGEAGPEAIIPLSAGNVVVDSLMKLADFGEQTVYYLYSIFKDIDGVIDEIWLFTKRIAEAITGTEGIKVQLPEGKEPGPAATPAQAPVPTTASPAGGKVEETASLGAVIASGRAEDYLKSIEISATDIATDVDYLSEMLNNSYKMVDALTDIATDVDYNSELLNNSYKSLDVLNLIANILDVGFHAIAAGLSIDHLIDATQRRQADGWAA